MQTLHALVFSTVIVWVPLVLVGWLMTLVRRRGIRRQWLRGSFTVALGCGIYWAFREMRPARLVAAQAHGNARSLLSFERVLGFGGVEMAVNHWANAHQGIGHPLAIFYGSAHLFVTAFLVCWLGASGHRAWRWALPALALMFVTALVVYAVHPIAPPWTMPGFRGLSGGVESGSAPAALEYAVCPSIHVAFATWAAMVGAAIWPRLRKVMWVYPAFVAFAVVATGNHYLTDCAAGAALSLCAVWLSKRTVKRLGAERAQQRPAQPAEMGGGRRLAPVSARQTDEKLTVDPEPPCAAPPVSAKAAV